MSAIKLKQPRSSVTTVTQTASPITKIGVSSTGATTTYTGNTVVDATAWDLSAITANEIALGVYVKTGDGCMGVVSAVDNVTDTVTVKNWIRPDFSDVAEGASAKPADGNACTLYKALIADGIVLTAIEANSVNVFAGFNSALPSDGTDGDEVSCTAGNPNSLRIYKWKNMDLTKLYVISASSSPKISWYTLGE
jgi:hypothetical protein